MLAVMGGILINDPIKSPPLRTAGGGRFCYLYRYDERFSRDASVSRAAIECVFEDTEILKKDFFGSAYYAAPLIRLSRVLPLRSGKIISHYIEQMEMSGFQPDVPDANHVFGDPLTGFLSVVGFAQYNLTFAVPPYDVLDDETAISLANVQNSKSPNSCVPEMFRFIRVVRNYLPEGRKVPSAGFEVYDDGVGAGHPVFQPFVVQEVGVLPSFQVDIVATSFFWPLKNFPDGGIVASLGYVNDSPMYLGNVLYPTGTLLYKGPAQGIEPYKHIDGNWYVDIPHRFGYRPQGWNQHRLNAPIDADGGRQWYPIRAKGVPGNKPMFLPGPLTSVFIPDFDH